MSEMTITVQTPTQQLAKLLREVDKSNPVPGAVSKLANHLAEHPRHAELLGELSDLTLRNITERSFTQPWIRTAIHVQLEHMRADLGYESANALERSLIKHIVLCWLRLHDCELRYHMAMDDNPTMQEALYWEKKLSSNQRRYLRATETLARVRRLNVKIQVNVAQQQIVTG